MDLFSPLLSWITEHANTFGLPGLIFLAYVHYRYKVNYRIFFGNPGDSEQLRAEHKNDLDNRIDLINSRSFENRYLHELTLGLDKVAQKWTRDEGSLLSPSKGWTRHWFGVNPFTPGSYQFCLRLALVYPLGAFILSWGMGGSGEFATLPVLDDQASGLDRLWANVGIACIIFFSYQLRVANTWAAMIIYYAVAFAFVLPVTDAATDAATRLFLANFALFFSIVFVAAVTAYSAGALAVALAAVFAFTVLVVVKGASAVSYNAAFAATFATILVVSVIAAVLYAKKENRIPYRESIYWWAFTLYFLLYSLASIYLVLRYGSAEHVKPILLPVFLCILPLLNAPVDWLSLGFTRGLLYAIKSGDHSPPKAIAWAFADLVLAISFLLLIASLTTSVMAIINTLAFHITGANLLDLNGLIAGLRHTPLATDYWWIHFMMLSTLVPTLVHFMIAGMALVLVLPESLRRKMVASLRPEDSISVLYVPETVREETKPRGDYRRYAFYYITFGPLLAFVGPAFLLWVLYQLVTAWHGALGFLLLDWVEWLVQSISSAF